MSHLIGPLEPKSRCSGPGRALLLIAAAVALGAIGSGCSPLDGKAAVDETDRERPVQGMTFSEFSVGGGDCPGRTHFAKYACCTRAAVNP